MFRPTQWTPPYRDGASVPQSFRAPPMIRVIVEATDRWHAEVGDNAHKVVEGVIDGYEAQLHQFVGARRQAAGLGGIQQRRAEMTLPGMRAMHDVNQNLEVLTLTVMPENVAAPANTEPEVAVTADEKLYDLMLDGYVAVGLNYAYTHADFPVAVSASLSVNGQEFWAGEVVAKDPDDKSWDIYIFAFGGDALRSHSIGNDETNPAGRLLGKITPKLGNRDQPPKPGGPGPNLLAYPMYCDSPSEYVLLAHHDNPSDPPNRDGTIISMHAGSTIAHKETGPVRNGALKPLGENAVSVTVTLETESSDTQQAIAVVKVIAWAEFYNRKLLRNVLLSWRRAATTPVIWVNDTPAIFASNMTADVSGSFTAPAITWVAKWVDGGTEVVTEVDQLGRNVSTTYYYFKLEEDFSDGSMQMLYDNQSYWGFVSINIANGAIVDWMAPPRSPRNTLRYPPYSQPPATGEGYTVDDCDQTFLAQVNALGAIGVPGAIDWGTPTTTAEFTFDLSKTVRDYWKQPIEPAGSSP